MNVMQSWDMHTLDDTSKNLIFLISYLKLAKILQTFCCFLLLACVCFNNVVSILKRAYVKRLDDINRLHRARSHMDGGGELARKKFGAGKK